MIDRMKIGREDVYTLTQGAEYTGLSPNTLRAQIIRGVLPATLAGKTYLVRAKDLDRYIRDHKGKHGKASPDYPHKGKGGAK